MILASVGAFAGKKETKTMTADKFIAEVKSYLGDMGTVKAHSFTGELSEIGGQCWVNLEKNEKGQIQVVLTSEKGFKIDAWIGDENVKLVSETDSDGSFYKSYTFGFMGLHKLEIVHVDDAYDHMILKAGTTTMSCDADY
jgi:superoxide dismutase